MTILMFVEGTPGVLAGPSLSDPEDVLVGSPSSLGQLIDELLGVRLLGDQVQDGILQSYQGPTKTYSVTLPE